MHIIITIWAIAFLIIGTFFGINMFGYLIKKKSAPNLSAGFHLINVIALILVIIAVIFIIDSILLFWSALLIILTAIGDILLFYFDKIKKMLVPKWLL